MVYYEHMKKISILLSLLITTLATSCGNGLNPNPNPPEPPEPESPYHIVDPSFACPIRGSQSEVTYTDLFNLGNKVSISIDITLEELQKYITIMIMIIRINQRHIVARTLLLFPC